MSRNIKNRPDIPFYLRYVPAISAVTFLMLLIMWFTVDLNGQLFGINACVVGITFAMFSVTGTISNFIMFRKLPKHRLFAPLEHFK